MLRTLRRLLAGLVAAALVGYAVGLLRNRALDRGTSRYAAPRPAAEPARHFGRP